MKSSQRFKILNYLKEGNTLTALEALHLFRCNRLAARILELKKAGYEIKSKRINRAGIHYSQYSLTK